MINFLEKLLNHVGRTIMKIAFWSIIVETILSAIAALVVGIVFAIGMDNPGILVLVIFAVPVAAVVSFFIALLTNLPLYALGELVENSTLLREMMESGVPAAPTPSGSTSSRSRNDSDDSAPYSVPEI